MDDYLLSIELSEDNQIIELHGNEEGLKKLSEIINRLLSHTKEGCFEHTHLMTPAWGGYELSDTNMGGKVINHVKLYCWKGNQPQK